MTIAIQRRDDGSPDSLHFSSTLESKFWWLCKINKLPMPMRQVRFCAGRKWTLDFCWMVAEDGSEIKIAVECDGEIHHARYHQTTKDALKRNRAAAMGYKVFVVTGEMLTKDPMGFIEMIQHELTKGEK